MVEKEEYDKLSKYKETIEKVIRNHAYSSLDIAFIEDLRTLAEKYGIKECRHCNSGTYNLIQWAYRKVLEYESAQLKNKEENSNESTEFKPIEGRKGKRKKQQKTEDIQGDI